MRSAREVLSAMVTAFDTGRVDDVAAYVDADYTDHQGLHGEEVRGVSGFVSVVEVARGGHTSLSVLIEDLIEEGDRAAARLRWLGTRPDDGVVSRETLEVVHVRDGRAVEHWGGRS
jgi:predicted ester cyclase